MEKKLLGKKKKLRILEDGLLKERRRLKLKLKLMS